MSALGSRYMKASREKVKPSIQRNMIKNTTTSWGWAERGGHSNPAYSRLVDDTYDPAPRTTCQLRMALGTWL